MVERKKTQQALQWGGKEQLSRETLVHDLTEMMRKQKSLEHYGQKNLKDHI